MAYIEGALKARLTGHAGVAAIVGTRVYRLQLPQGTALPAITLWTDGTPREHVMGGDCAKVGANVYVACWAEDDAAVEALAAQVRAALRNYAGTQLGVVIANCFLEDEHDDVEDDTRRHRITLRFTVWYTES